MCRRGMAQHFGGPIHCRPSEKVATTMTTTTTMNMMYTGGIRQRHNRSVGLRPLILLLNSAIVWCSLAQPHAVEAASSGHLAPMVPNSPLSIQSDPNFLRFGRSGSLNEFGIPHLIPTRTSSNFLRFGKSSASMSTSEPNFLRFGRQKGGVDPTFLRFGRANNNFLRFGRAAGGELLVAAEEEPFERDYRQANPNFLRFG
uniref:Uncharacterized protein n=1 Tax=Globodera rostochiensis TaxID=31243 RepID=A0A914H8E5_GLORO